MPKLDKYFQEQENYSTQRSASEEFRKMMRAYVGIFTTPSDDFVLTGVKHLGEEFIGQYNDNSTHRFLAIVEAPSSLHYNTYVPSNVFKKMRDWMVRRYEKEFGSELLHEVKWKSVNKWGRKRSKYFHFVVRICPSAILAFELVGGKYRILIECYGMFY